MTPKRQARLWNQVSQRELENLWNQVGKKKNERAGELLESSGSKGKKEEERMKELLESGSKEKEKGDDVLMDNVIRVWWTKCKRKKRKKEKGNVWTKERQRIRSHNLKILPQYFHNKF